MTWGILSVLAVCLWGLAQSERAGHATQQRLVGWGAPLSPRVMGSLPNPGPTRKLPERGSPRAGRLRETPRTTASTQLDEGVGFCRFDGLLLYQGAVWSPRLCTVCACEAAGASCQDIECPTLRCRKTQRLDGQCCAVCMQEHRQGTATSQGIETAWSGRHEHISAGKKEGKRAPEARGNRRDAEKREPSGRTGRRPLFQARGRKLAMEDTGAHRDRALLREMRPSTKPRQGTLRQRGAASRDDLGRPKVGLKASGRVGGELGIKGPGVSLKGPEAGLKKLDGGLKKVGLKSPELSLKKPDASLKSPELGLKEPDVDMKEPEVGPQSPEVDLKSPELSLKEPNVGLKSPELSLKKPNIGLKSPEVGQKKVEVGLKKVGLKSPEKSLKEPDVSMKEPDVGMKKPEVGLKKVGLKSPELSLKKSDIGLKSKEVGLKKPDANLMSPEVGLKEPNISIKSPEVGLKKVEVGLKKVGLKNLKLSLKEPGIGRKSPELSLKEPDVGMKEPEFGLKKPDVGLKSSEVGLKKPEVGLKKVGRVEGKVGLNKPEVSLKKVGLKKPEVGLKKPEVGLKLLEVGLKKAEVDLETPEAGDQKLKRGLGVKKLDVGRKKPNVGHKATKAGTRQDTAQRRRAEARGSVRAQNTRPDEEQAGRGEPETGRAEVARKQARKTPGARRDAKESQAGAASSPVPFPRELLPPPESELGAPSLPVGCILAESAIACPASKLTEIPKLVDAGLQTLYLADNAIRLISVSDFAGVPNLQWLDLSRNRIAGDGLEKDAFRNLTKLRRLNLDGNRIDHVPRLPASLKELKMNDNRLLGLHRHSFRGLHQLLTLDLEGNGLNDGNVNPSAMRPLTNLLYLRLGRNRFRAVPSGLPPSLKELHLEDNRIEEIPSGLLNKTLNLTILILRNNHLEETGIDPRAWIHLRKLEMLDLSHNRLVHVPSFLPTGVRQLLLHHNRIERIPGYVFAHLDPGLEFLHLSHNRLQHDGIHAISFLGLYDSLHELLLDHNRLRQIPRGILNLRTLQVLRLSDNHISDVPLDSVCDTRISEDSSLVSVHLENNLIDRRLIPPTAFSCIRSYHSVILRPQKNEE